jgi:hypothetical protein
MHERLSHNETKYSIPFISWPILLILISCNTLRFVSFNGGFSWDLFLLALQHSREFLLFEWRTDINNVCRHITSLEILQFMASTTAPMRGSLNVINDPFYVPCRENLQTVGFIILVMIFRQVSMRHTTLLILLKEKVWRVLIASSFIIEEGLFFSFMSCY